MKSFSNVCELNNKKLNESKKVDIDNQRVKLVTTIKKLYGISNFNALSESEKSTYKSIINEMWSPITGLNTKGLKFINEGELYDAYKFDPLLLNLGVYKFIESKGFNVKNFYMIDTNEKGVSDISREATEDERKFNRFVWRLATQQGWGRGDAAYEIGVEQVYIEDLKDHKFILNVAWGPNGKAPMLLMDIDSMKFLYDYYLKILEKHKNDKK